MLGFTTGFIFMEMKVALTIFISSILAISPDIWSIGDAYTGICNRVGKH